ncbi:MAG: hypothetical protein ACREBR_01685, partial [bacterium]
MVDVVQYANVLGSDAARLITPPGVSGSRWQVKCEVTRLASLALADLVAIVMESSSTSEALCTSADFKPIEAEQTLTSECRKSTSSSASLKSPKIHSFLALHLEDMMTAESAAATAKSDQAELHSLQRRGVMLLSALVWYFRNAMESKHATAAETNGPIALIQLSPQINS